MQRIDIASAVGSLPAPAAPGTPGYFQNNNALAGTPGTEIDADWMNMVQEEILAVIVAAGESPSKSTYTQLRDAINTLAGAAGFPSGTALVFAQSAAPTGWTKVTTTNDAALRLVSGSASSGGSVGFTSAFASQAVGGSTDGYALAAADIPTHTHHNGVCDAIGGGGAFNHGTVTASPNSASQMTTTSSAGVKEGVTDGGSGGGGAHSHGLTGTSINLAVKYKDVIICTKN